MRLLSWNINGIRAWIRKMESRYGGLARFLQDHQVDIACFQETKVSTFEDMTIDEKMSSLIFIEGYETFWSFSQRRKGWSGVVTYAKIGLTRDAWEEHLNLFLPNEERDTVDPLASEDSLNSTTMMTTTTTSTTSTITATFPTTGRMSSASSPNDLPSPSKDYEGRIIVTDHGTFRLFNIYFPNAGMGELRLRYKLTFYEAFQRHIDQLIRSGDGAPIIVCGDVNTAHKEIDVWNPRKFETHTGFLPVERHWIDLMVDTIDAPFIDTFRYFHPAEVRRFTYWDTVRNARPRNDGWRIDVFWLQRPLESIMLSADIWSNILGSDHCPVILDLKDSMVRPDRPFDTPSCSVRYVSRGSSHLRNRKSDKNNDLGPSQQFTLSNFFSRKRSFDVVSHQESNVSLETNPLQVSSIDPYPIATTQPASAPLSQSSSGVSNEPRNSLKFYFSEKTRQNH
jgi:exodeoxyribonuclease III